MDWKEKYKKMLLGLGFDAKDGHTRITKGNNFYLFGGSKNTHSQMQEISIKFNEQLKKKNKTLDEISEKEFIDIAHKIGIKDTKDTRKRF
ncbi:MAG: hypothetical protein PHY56_00475 [Candidatus Omnitrophica bacterium]|nr:hypothetical protein [Candidatus Omnitrophota bacterium]